MPGKRRRYLKANGTLYMTLEVRFSASALKAGNRGRWPPQEYDLDKDLAALYDI